MDRIPAKEGPDRPVRPHPHLAGRMAGQRHQLQPGPEFITVVHQLRPPRLQDGQHAVLETAQLQGIAVGPAALVLPVPQLEPADQVARVREGRDPAAVEQARIPADVIDVQVGAEHEVDRLRLDTGLGETFEEPALVTAVKVRNEGPLLALADAGIDQDRSARCTEHKGLDGEDQHAAFQIRMVGLKEGSCGVGLSGLGLGKELRDRELKLVDIDQHLHHTVPDLEAHDSRSQ